jgi:L-threonylcarbamoyladenylate synthase
MRHALSAEDLLKALLCLREDDVVGVPSETVYGLAGNACSARAVARIFQLKGRPAHNPLIVHDVVLERLKAQVVWTPLAEKLARVFLPGPLTLVLTRGSSCTLTEAVSAGLPSVAVRMPAHPVFQSLLRASPWPLAAPSANPSGKLSPTATVHVEEAFPKVMVLPGDEAVLGLESTVLDARGVVPILLRQGALTTADIQRATGALENRTEQTAPEEKALISPGQLLQHYAPCKPLRLEATTVQEDEGLLAFGHDLPPGAQVVFNLSDRGDLGEAAQRFFKGLHALDKASVKRIAVMPLPRHGLGVVLYDRLRRAAMKT